MKRRMTGVVHITKIDSVGKPRELTFISPLFGEFILAKNQSWDRLKNLTLQPIEAVGFIYFEAAKNTQNQRKIFFVKRFLLRGDSFFDEKDLAEQGIGSRLGIEDSKMPRVDERCSIVVDLTIPKIVGPLSLKQSNFEYCEVA